MEFMLGCNYWASNAGAEMWMQWDENTVEQDLGKLSSYGIKYLRVFPNWRDFQPVCAYYEIKNRFKEYRHRDGSFFDNSYYIDMNVLEHFERFCEIASKYDMKLIVGIITGWMSGRAFVPPLLEGKDLYRDETALMLQQKFVKGFVSHLYDKNAVFAWDLGNECNCLSEAGNREVAATWTAMIANAIRANDPLHKPIVSGMHGLSINKEWTVFDQGENVDVLTTHPYPHFVEHCDKDHMTSFRTLLHATCEGVYYSDLGGKPCLTEEIGTLGPMTCDDETGSAFLKTNLYSNWANGSLGVLWWCGCEQVKLTTAPYSWCMMERELGLMDIDRNPRKTLLTYKAFSEWLKGFGRELPKARTDAVCIVTEDQDHWGVAYMTYALAKQAHVNLKFVYGQARTLLDSDIYLMPSISGTCVICKETFDQLMKKVYQGATLYISNDNGYLAQFEQFSGVHICNSMRHNDQCSMKFNEEKTIFERKKRHIIKSMGAEVLACDNLGIPTFTKNIFGNGTVYYLNFPLETMLLDENFAFDSNRHKIYDKLFEETKKKHPVAVENKYVGMTCHDAADCYYVVLVNYSDQKQEVGLTVNGDYEITETYGEDIQYLPANEAAVVTLKKK